MSIICLETEAANNDSDSCALCRSSMPRTPLQSHSNQFAIETKGQVSRSTAAGAELVLGNMEPQDEATVDELSIRALGLAALTKQEAQDEEFDFEVPEVSGTSQPRAEPASKALEISSAPRQNVSSPSSLYQQTSPPALNMHPGRRYQIPLVVMDYDKIMTYSRTATPP